MLYIAKCDTCENQDTTGTFNSTPKGFSVIRLSYGKTNKSYILCDKCAKARGINPDNIWAGTDKPDLLDIIVDRVLEEIANQV